MLSKCELSTVRCDDDDGDDDEYDDGDDDNDEAIEQERHRRQIYPEGIEKQYKAFKEKESNGMEEVRKEKEKIQNQFDRAIASLDLHIQSNVAAASQPKQDR